MRVRRACAIALVIWSAACGGGGIFRQYEYEEEMYLSLDGSATIYVNSSIAALNALRGTSFEMSPTTPVDRERVRTYFSGPDTQVTWVRSSRRNGRRFVHVRLEVHDIRRLAAVAPFSWSSYNFERSGNVFVYQQAIGPPGGKATAFPGWTGRELVAFRLHLPSKIEEHNTLPDNHRRGNILVWEQSLSDRLRGVPLTLEAKMQTQSILYRTLWLFAATFLAVAAAFGFLVWWILRRGAPHSVGADPSVPTPGSAPTVK
jgi:nitrate reductase NapE component